MGFRWLLGEQRSFGGENFWSLFGRVKLWLEPSSEKLKGRIYVVEISFHLENSAMKWVFFFLKHSLDLVGKIDFSGARLETETRLLE